ncbi:MAG: oxidoreductase, partial [bacterium]|nr:oxidoreductase [bacterium]
IARQATDREALQMRMQGNAFLGAFFRLSSFLKQNKIGQEHFREVVRKQYQKKFGRLGEAVVESNMRVMTGGFERVRRVEYGEIEAPDRSTMRGRALLPVLAGGPEVGDSEPRSLPMACRETFNREFRADHGYHQPASALASVGMIAAATGEEASKYVARRQTPFFIADKCTQCMECIAVCPDTALPNTAQDVGSVLRTAIEHYVTDETHRRDLLGHLEPLETRLRKRMKEGVEAAKALDRAEAALRSARRKAQKATGDEAGENVARAEAVVEAAQAIRREKALPVADLVRQELAGGFDEARAQFLEILDCIPLAYLDVHAIFRNVENKAPGEGGVFSIFVSDLCKGCAECVEACGTHEALVMRDETEELNAEHQTGTEFLRLLPETPARFLGLYDDQRPQDSKWAALRNHLMVRRNYEALASGDGACAGCGEKSVLRALASVTEAYMRPIYHAKAERLRTKADELERHGRERLARLRTRSAERHELFRKTFAHTVLGLGGESEEDTARRIEAAAKSLTDGAIVGGLAAVLRREAIAHDQLRPVDGRLANGMSVMAMGAHTGCNTVYGSTPPNNPHPYPWMNSLFQDGATISWLMGESFILDQA